MAKLSKYCMLMLILILSGCLLVLWSQSSFNDRSIIRQIWKSYARNTNISHTTTRIHTIDYESITVGQISTGGESRGVITSGQHAGEYRTRITTSGQYVSTATEPGALTHDVSSMGEAGARCTPRKNIAFLKTHKCGSSTMQNILLRYGDEHNLTFALPKIGNYAYDHMFTMDRLLKREFVEELPVPRYNILCQHCVYNESAFRDIVYDGALIMTVIRSPARVFESTFSYFGYAKHLGLTNYPNPLLEFMNRAEKAKPSDRSYATKRNPMLKPFGLLTNKDNQSVIDSLIDHLKSSIEFAVITDHFDESLILLKEKLCWDFDDIVYFPQLVRIDENRNAIDANLAERIERWNFGDVSLFEYFNQSLWREIDEFGRDRMRKELQKFKERKQFWKDKCTEGANVSRFFISLKEKRELSVDSTCWKMTRSEIFYTRYLRKKQHLSFNIY